MKYLNESITVDARNSVPYRFRWQGRTYRTRKLLDYWILQTRWWGREEKRIYFRLETNHGVMEVYRAAEFSTIEASSGVSRASADGAPKTFSQVSEGSDACSSSRGAPLHLPIEGDTHTRERRRTDAAYRPDVRMMEEARRKAAASDRNRTRRVRWVLSKVVD